MTAWVRSACLTGGCQVAARLPFQLWVPLVESRLPPRQHKITKLLFICICILAAFNLHLKLRSVAVEVPGELVAFTCSHGIFREKAVRGSSITGSACGLIARPLPCCFIRAENMMKLPISGTVDPRALNLSELQQSMLVQLAACRQPGFITFYLNGRISFRSASSVGYDGFIPHCSGAFF